MLRATLLLLLPVWSVGQSATGALGSQHVLELFHSKELSSEAVVEVFKGLGVAADKAMPLVVKLAEKGRQVVIAGTKETCEAASKRFEDVGMKAVARPLQKSDVPTEYSDSDVVEADEVTFQALFQDQNQGALVTFYAPWCGHCIKMVPEFKRAASMLKRGGVKAAAVNSDNAPNLARSLGIKGFPTVRWVYAGQMTEYAGARTAVEMVNFANQQNVLTKVRKAVNGAITGTKLAMSKVLGRMGRRDGNAATAPGSPEARGTSEPAASAQCSVDAAPPAMSA